MIFQKNWAFYVAFCAYRPRLIRDAATDASQCPRVGDRDHDCNCFPSAPATLPLYNFSSMALLPTPLTLPLAALPSFFLLSLPALVTTLSSTANTISFLFCFTASLANPYRWACWKLRLQIIYRQIRIIHLKRNTDKKSHEIVYGVRSKQPIDHIPTAEYYITFKPKFTSHKHELHKRISNNVAHNKFKTLGKDLKLLMLIM